MLTCKVKPTHNQCWGCIDTHLSYNEAHDCNECMKQGKDGIIIDTHTNIFGSSAMVAIDGVIEKVSIDRVYDVKPV